MAQMTISFESTLDQRRERADRLANAKPNSIAVKRPDLLEEWDWARNKEIGLCPQQVTIGSGERVWWLCPSYGHSYDALVSNRTAGKGCPYCSNQKVLTGFNDLQSKFPDIASEWDYEKNAESRLSPDKVICTSNKKVWWLCKQGHSWEAVVSQRTRTGTGCPFCVGKKPIIGVTDLATTNPELARQWHPTKNGDITPQMVKAQSGKKAWWLCSNGHDWRAVIQSRDNGCDCPYCTNRRVWQGFNDIATVYPEIASEWDYSRNEKEPEDYVYGSNEYVWWKCSKCSGVYKMTICARTTRSRGCPYCAGQKVLAGYNDLASTNPTIANEWHPTKNGSALPTDFTAGSTKRVWWICPEGHDYEAAIGSRTAQKTGCPYCAGKKVLRGYNDLATTHPNIAAEWHPTKNGNVTPHMVSFGTRKQYWFTCKHGHEYKAILANRTCLGQGCPYCAGQRLIVGENDLATCAPELAKEWHANKNGTLTPRDVTKSCAKKVWWTCPNGHDYYSKISNRWSLGEGCPICSYGRSVSFPEKATFFYVKQICPDAIPNSHGPKDILGRKTLDIYIPSLSAAIEYDGYHWHSDTNNDKAKDDLCSANGIRIVRIREEGCPTYESSAVFISRRSPFDEASLAESIQGVIATLTGGCPISINIQADKDAIKALTEGATEYEEVVAEQLVLPV